MISDIILFVRNVFWVIKFITHVAFILIPVVCTEVKRNIKACLNATLTLIFIMVNTMTTVAIMMFISVMLMAMIIMRVMSVLTSMTAVSRLLRS